MQKDAPLAPGHFFCVICSADLLLQLLIPPRSNAALARCKSTHIHISRGLKTAVAGDFTSR
jgi:hypothetical protein